jgi:hypothetical protein
MTARAAETVDAIAGKLADPARVAAITGEPANCLLVDGQKRSPWSSLSLSCGNPAVTLLFAELEDRERAHDYLAAGLVDPLWTAKAGLFGGMGSIAFAAAAASRAYGGYSALLSQFDSAMAAGAGPWAAAERARVEAGEPIGSWSYDVVSGFSGVGRHLLSRYETTANPATRTAVIELLSALVAIAVAGVPAWWVHHGRNRQPHTGHLNFGLAHGIAGPLAFLSIAWRAGVRVPRQDEAIDKIVALLLRVLSTDQAGPYWPHTLSQLENAVGERPRDVWCYGGAGIARALFLAGSATGNPAWEALAHQSLHSALTTSNNLDYGLCHGWAGLLHITTVMAYDSQNSDYQAAATGIADRICDAYDEKLPFGFQAAHPLAAQDLNRPGFLEGSAGIALALHSYATGRPPRTQWDAALLLT